MRNFSLLHEARLSLLSTGPRTIVRFLRSYLRRLVSLIKCKIDKYLSVTVNL